MCPPENKISSDLAKRNHSRFSTLPALDTDENSLVAACRDRDRARRDAQAYLAENRRLRELIRKTKSDLEQVIENYPINADGSF